MLDVGDVYPTAVVVRDASGEPADATAVACRVTGPDGSVRELPVERWAVGSYRAGLLLDAPGLWAVDWSATGLNASAYSDSVAARDPRRVPVLSLAEAKAYLNIAGSESDEELRGFLDAVTAKGEEITGRVFGRRTEVAVVRGGSSSVLLPSGPVLSLVSASAGGAAVDLAGAEVSAGAAVVRLPGGWPAGPVSVVYAAGYAVQPATDVMGAKMLLRWLWQSQRGTVRRASAGEWAPGDGWDIPNAVMGQWRDRIETGFA